MATKKIAMEYVIHQNKIKDSEGFGKYYAQPVVRTTLSLQGFARHLHDHNGTYKTSVIKGVIEEMTECLIEMISQGVGVKLDGLGTFRPTFECEGADTEDDFNISENLKGIHIRFIPEGVKDEELTSRKFMAKCVLKRRTQLVGEAVDGGGDGGDGDTGNNEGGEG